MEVLDKVAMITGGGRGLGKAIALNLAREGADIVVLGRSPEPLEQTAREVTALGRKALAVPTDVADSSQVAAAVQQMLAAFGKIDILVNNAASLPHSIGRQ
ncbi:MAG: SDR family NAD(P)-dependent oxidoreductase, partial [Dehalococcoidales bacterium]